MEQTHLTPIAKVNLRAYREIIGKYLPAVLIKCTKFTNNKRLAEIITRFTFICAYQLVERLDGANKISIVIESMLNVIGPNYADGPNTVIREKLFDDGTFLKAKSLAELDMENIGGVNPALRTLDRQQLERITESVMNNLSRKGE